MARKHLLLLHIKSLHLRTTSHIIHQNLTKMKQEYTEEELKKLHHCLHEILKETARVCHELGIRFFMVGGSVIGCHFWNDIIPFDDDIDIGMTRNDYERFLQEAPAKLGSKFFLQWLGTDPHTPFYFAKVRMNGTEFVEETTRHIKMHQGIFVDVFPFDRIPDDARLCRRQRKMVNTINAMLVSKEIWRWRYFGRCALPQPLPHSWLSCLIDRLAVTFVPKRWLYAWLKREQTRYNDQKTAFYNHVVTDIDQIRAENIELLETATFGELQVFVPGNYMEYLNHHYPNLRKHLPQEEIDKYSHRPLRLSFGGQ